METKILKNIVSSEIIKSKKKALLSDRVIRTFLKIANGRNLELKKHAIDQYNKTTQENKKLSSFTLSKEKIIVNKGVPGGIRRQSKRVWRW